MLGRIITIFILVAAAIFIFSWLSGGGWERIKILSTTFPNPLGEFWEEQKGKPIVYSAEALAPAVPKVGENSSITYIKSSGTSIWSTDSERARQAELAKEFGNPSPLRGLVSFEKTYSYGPKIKERNGEYVVIKSSKDNTSPINVTGWSISSAVSGVRAFIPSGTNLYKLGTSPNIGSIFLDSGNEAIINTGESPVGITFKTNICSGYLSQFQSFSPTLTNSCPSPRTELPNTLDNLQKYGAECIDFVKTIPSCTYYLGSFKEGISSSCRSFITNALSYNSCIDKHQWDSNFEEGLWRIYLNSSNELWNNSHDVIRLLDASGRTVDVWSY